MDALFTLPNVAIQALGVTAGAVVALAVGFVAMGWFIYRSRRHG